MLKFGGDALLIFFDGDAHAARAAAAALATTHRAPRRRGPRSRIPLIARLAKETTVPKELKADSSRKPPAPSADHAEIEEWMRGVMPGLNPLVERLDKMIRDAIPDLQFAVKWKKAYYGLPDRGWVIELVAYDVSVNVVFFAGADFDPPPPLGTTGRTRYIKLRSLDEVEQPELTKWIEQSGRLPGWA